VPKVPNPESVDDDLRHISLTPVLSKILERFFFLWLCCYVWPHLDPYQYQYRSIKNSSTTHALIQLIHHWLVALEKPGNSIRSSMIDFSKAVDRVDHNILLEKLSNFNVPQYRSKLDNWGGGAHIHIFVFCVINFFSDRLFLWSVNMNIWIWASPPHFRACYGTAWCANFPHTIWCANFLGHVISE
jgi:hypothetical protein